MKRRMKKSVKPSKKILVFVVSTVIVLVFAVLVYHAYLHRRGAPLAMPAEPEKALLRVHYLNKAVNLRKNQIDFRIWENVDGLDLKLTYQVTIAPWGQALVPNLKVKAFHNGKDIFFKISYVDKTKNDTIAMSEFSDGVAVMFPLGDTANPESIMMGFQGKVNIWHWRALEDKEYWIMRETNPKVESAVADLLSAGMGTLTPKTKQRVLGRGYKTEDTWEIVLTRGLSVLNPDEDAAFVPGASYVCAFAVWDGEQADRGPRKSISTFIRLRIE